MEDLDDYIAQLNAEPQIDETRLFKSQAVTLTQNQGYVPCSPVQECKLL